jgi:Predicted membrane protein
MTAPTATPTSQSSRWYPLASVLLAIIGWAASLALTIDKINLLQDPTYTPSCSISPLLSCGSVINTPQASVLGFPNPLLGIAGFAAAGMFGVALATGWTPPRWMWVTYATATTTAAAFMHWLIFQSLAVIGALCPYCMVVWAVTIPLWWWTVLQTLRATAPHNRTTTLLNKFPLFPVTVWFTAVALTIFLRWQDYWLTTIGL